MKKNLALFFILTCIFNANSVLGAEEQKDEVRQVERIKYDMWKIQGLLRGESFYDFRLGKEELKQEASLILDEKKHGARVIADIVMGLDVYQTVQEKEYSTKELFTQDLKEKAFQFYKTDFVSDSGVSSESLIRLIFFLEKNLENSQQSKYPRLTINELERLIKQQKEGTRSWMPVFLAEKLFKSSRQEIKQIGVKLVKEVIEKEANDSSVPRVLNDYIASGLNEEELRQLADYLLKGFNYHSNNTKVSFAEALIEMGRYVFEAVVVADKSTKVMQALQNLALNGTEPEKAHARFLIRSILPNTKGILLHAQSILASKDLGPKAEAAKVVIEYSQNDQERAKAFEILIPLNRKGKPFGGPEKANEIADEVRNIITSKAQAYQRYARYVGRKLQELGIFQNPVLGPGRVKLNKEEKQRKSFVTGFERK